MASAAHVRVRLTHEAFGTKKLVRESGAEYLEIGAGKPQEMSHRKFIILCRAIVQAAKQYKFKKIAVQFDKTPELFQNLQTFTPEEMSALAAQNFEMANFEFTTFKTKPKGGWPVVEEILATGKSYKSIELAVRKGQEIGRAVNACRELSNTPGGDMTPTTLAQAAKKATAKLPIKVMTLGEKEMKKLGMGAILGVSKGSDEPATFTVMQYKGGKGKPIVLAGKGITFDSGGINLKAGDGHEMHMDMSGAAAVIHAVALAARLKVKKHVIGLIPASENMPGSGALRPHDILRSMSGKTIEVLNTDAEGRLILADALTYAKRFTPGVVIDVATLTGASMVALGAHASGVMSRDDELATTISDLGERTGDYMWRLPLWDEYEEGIKSAFADVANTGVGQKSRYGGATEGGIFLWQFAKELGCPWAHIDMAPRMTAHSSEELAKGAAGTPVRLLYAFIEQWKP